jgi:hypothetical protein
MGEGNLTFRFYSRARIQLKDLWNNLLGTLDTVLVEV